MSDKQKKDYCRAMVIRTKWYKNEWVRLIINSVLFIVTICLMFDYAKADNESVAIAVIYTLLVLTELYFMTECVIRIVFDTDLVARHLYIILFETWYDDCHGHNIRDAFEDLTKFFVDDPMISANYASINTENPTIEDSDKLKTILVCVMLQNIDKFHKGHFFN